VASLACSCSSQTNQLAFRQPVVQSRGLRSAAAFIAVLIRCFNTPLFSDGGIPLVKPQALQRNELVLRLLGDWRSVSVSGPMRSCNLSERRR
jgi:hypothetical protein